MKRFALKTLLFNLPFIAALVWVALDLEHLKKEPFRDSVERRIAALALTSPEKQVIIAGDSRAEIQIISPLLDSLTNTRSVNVAAGGCDLVTTYNALERNGLLTDGKVVILSVSLFQINENAFTPNIPSVASLLNMSPSESARLIAANTDRALAPLQRCARAITSKALADMARLLPSSIHGNAGLQESPSRVLHGKIDFDDPGVLDPLKINSEYYRNLEIRGINREIFIRTMRKIGKSKGRFVIFHGPMSPRWRAATMGSFVEKAEMEFSSLLEEEARRHPNITFLDLYQEMRDSIPEELFHDSAHLNAKGARIFTMMLSHKLWQAHALKFDQSTGSGEVHAASR